MKNQKLIKVNLKIAEKENHQKIITGVVALNDLYSLDKIKFIKLRLLNRSSKVKGFIFINTAYIIDISSKTFFFNNKNEHKSK